MGRENYYGLILKAREMGWTPTNPNDLTRYHQALDYESTGDDEFLDALAREASHWIIDNEERG